ncbi:hypothetical protein C0J52_12096 [Blattella germanica]|nr:hypothetical protein C0J52_12096 [Blattella germanica]
MRRSRHLKMNDTGKTNAEVLTAAQRNFQIVSTGLMALTKLRVLSALETSVGVWLHNVIVDNEVTAKKLLQNEQLQRRTTFIHLNKIVAHCIDQRTVSLAEQLVGKENVQLALSPIE